MSKTYQVFQQAQWRKVLVVRLQAWHRAVALFQLLDPLYPGLAHHRHRIRLDIIHGHITDIIQIVGFMERLGNRSCGATDQHALVSEVSP